MDDQNINQEIMDKLTKVCLCKGISRATIKSAIANGAKTVEDVKNVVGATTGSCGGRRRKEKIEELIKQFG